MADVANAINEFKRRKDLGEDVKDCPIQLFANKYIYYARKYGQKRSDIFKPNMHNVVSTGTNIAKI